MTEFATGPELGSLRIARPDDVLRCGIVATASYRYSPVFRWERPHHSSFPEDTLLSYRIMAMEAIRADDVIVLVTEDEFKQGETDETEAVIADRNGWDPPEEGDDVVVGWTAIQLEPGSKHRGQFLDLEGSFPELPPNQGRDLNRNHYDSWGKKVGEAKHRDLQGCSFMNTLVVHPAYWNRGHGTRLVQWSIDLARHDSVNQGVSAAAMGLKLYRKLGFTSIRRLEEEGDEDDPEGVCTELLELRAGSRNVDM